MLTDTVQLNMLDDIAHIDICTCFVLYIKIYVNLKIHINLLNK